MRDYDGWFARHTGAGIGPGGGPLTAESPVGTVHPVNVPTRSRTGIVRNADQELLRSVDAAQCQTPDPLDNCGPTGVPRDRRPVTLVRTAFGPADSGSPFLLLRDPLAPTGQSAGTLALGVAGSEALGALAIERLDHHLPLAGAELDKRFRLWDGRHPKP